MGDVEQGHHQSASGKRMTGPMSAIERLIGPLEDMPVRGLRAFRAR